MARRQRAVTREVLPDPQYGSESVAKFVNALMSEGKKSLAEKIFYEAMRTVEERTGQPAMNVYRQAFSNTKPVLEVKSRRVGGATYQVPVEVRPRRRDALARRWLIAAARERSERTMAERLAGELIAAAKGEGASVRKKQDVHRMAEANKAFAHYRW
ncbi:MAG: 30S ribosomal protein S7 [Planctomycetes bacterium SM23_65]|jgi:small subunit ribosomal protein S7|nr:MAG: 30S ribosomal protein S7 [Planctomycetes bacterium SM23_65]